MLVNKYCFKLDVAVLLILILIFFEIYLNFYFLAENHQYSNKCSEQTCIRVILHYHY